MNSYHPHHARAADDHQNDDREGTGNSRVAGATAAPAATRTPARRTAQSQATGSGDKAELHEQTDTDGEPDDRAKRADVEEGAHRDAAVAVRPGQRNHHEREAEPSGEHADDAREEAENNSHDQTLRARARRRPR